MKKFFLYFSLSFILRVSFSQEEARLMRFPHVSENFVVFSYAGDLYRVSKKGGEATKLTSHVGYESFAKISPDEKEIAFTGQYDGNTEVYKIPITGGNPIRLTYTATLARDEVDDRMGPNNIVLAWKKDSIIFRSRMHSFNPFIGQLYQISSKGNEYKQLPMTTGSWISYNQDESQLAYNEIFREFRAWKRYKGGMADDIRIIDFKTKKIENITKNDAQDVFPMWYENSVFFASDRTGVMNIFSYDINSKETKQITFYTDYDVKFPSIGKTEIVYEQAGFLHLLDLKTLQTEKIKIQISDELNASRNEWIDASKYIHFSDISPSGKRVLLSARGDIFSVPTKEGITYNLSKSSNSDEREAIWSPNGKSIAIISDKDGSEEIYIYNTENQTLNQITQKSDSPMWGLKWSSDSKKLLFTDRKLRLQVLDINSNSKEIIFQGNADLFRSYEWSPDGNWICFAVANRNASTQIYLWNTSQKKSFIATSPQYNSSEAIFSADSKNLIFTSQRSFNPTYGETEWNHIYTDLEKIYILPLYENKWNTLTNDTEKIKTETDSSKTKPTNKNTKKSPKLEFVFDNLFNRVYELPIEAASYTNLSVKENTLFYITSQKGGTSRLKSFDLSEKKENDLLEVENYSLSADKSTFLFLQKGGIYSTAPANSKKIDSPENLILSNMQIWMNKKEEWEQILKSAHRRYKHYFYANNMHGVNWDDIYNKYAVFLPYINHRSDLTYIISEMIGELNVGHAYVGKGDVPEVSKVSLGLLGADLKRTKSGFYKIEHICEGKNWNANFSSPLKTYSSDIKVGDFIISINGKKLSENTSLENELLNTSDKTIELGYNTTESDKNTKTCLLKPLKEEYYVRYADWVNKNMRYVDSVSNGEIGYIHIPDMISSGLNEFVEHFYPQLNKKGLIIDDRGNGGGNVSQQIIERLNRELVMLNTRRDMVPGTNPYQMHVGPKALLIDQYSASDGDLFAYRFKTLKLGPVIGRRTWGGVVGYSGTFKFSDNGYLVTPEYAHYGVKENDWIIEGVGVSPDLEIFNSVFDEYQGKDAQLDKGIEEIQKLIQNTKVSVPEIKEFPKK